MLIYKIFRPAEWDSLASAGTTTGAPIDVSDGFIHFSTAEQVRATAALHFAQAGDLVLAAVEADALGQDLKWEASRDGALFPHLFRELRLDDVVWHVPLPQVGRAHEFPAMLDGDDA
ncbi:MAG: DUF952 domain-containing protein [Pseudomonadota bacterium]